MIRHLSPTVQVRAAIVNLKEVRTCIVISRNTKKTANDMLSRGFRSMRSVGRSVSTRRKLKFKGENGMQYLTVIISLAAIAISVSNISYIKKRDKEMEAYYKNRKNK